MGTSASRPAVASSSRPRPRRAWTISSSVEPVGDRRVCAPWTRTARRRASWILPAGLGQPVEAVRVGLQPSAAPERPEGLTPGGLGQPGRACSRSISVKVAAAGEQRLDGRRPHQDHGIGCLFASLISATTISEMRVALGRRNEKRNHFTASAPRSRRRSGTSDCSFVHPTQLTTRHLRRQPSTRTDPSRWRRSAGDRLRQKRLTLPARPSSRCIDGQSRQPRCAMNEDPAAI